MHVIDALTYILMMLMLIQFASDPVMPTIFKSSGLQDMSQTLQANVSIGQSVDVLYGAQVFIRCPFKAEPAATVIWSGDGDSDLKARGAIEIDEGRALMIPKATEVSKGVYQCIVSNIFGSDFAKTAISVTGMK